MNDYKSIGTPTESVLATPMATSLYNGNISTMSTQTPAFAQNTATPMPTNFTKQFTYDQLNRIKTGKVIDGASNSFATAYSYDANGNILTLERSNGAGKKFDSLAYVYHNVDKGYLKNTNKLRYVTDAKNTVEDKALHTEDIENQGIDNYDYDEIGNLIKDEAEDIERIEWTVSGKVYAVIRKSGSSKANLYFSYDAMGNRISKKSVDPELGNVHTTYYFREASGNTMATYEKKAAQSFTLTEQHIYGSSRLGMYTPSAQSIDDSPQESVTIDNRLLTSSYYVGNRTYEFSDHLGNVHLVLSDKRTELDNTPIIKAATEYYPFGMVVQSYPINDDYRYGFHSGN